MNNKQVIANLRKIAKDPEFFYPLGLCSYLSCGLNRHDLMTILGEQLPSWPLFSGILNYPVPHPQLDPGIAYHRTRKWGIKTVYGQNRRALCLWFADYLEQNLLGDEK